MTRAHNGLNPHLRASVDFFGFVPQKLNVVNRIIVWIEPTIVALRGNHPQRRNYVITFVLNITSNKNQSVA